MSNFSSGLTGALSASVLNTILSNYLPTRVWKDGESNTANNDDTTAEISSPDTLDSSLFSVSVVADSIYVLEGIVAVSANSVQDTWILQAYTDNGAGAIDGRSYYTAPGTASHGVTLTIPIRGVFYDLSVESTDFSVQWGCDSSPNGNLYAGPRSFTLMEFKKRSS